MKNINLLNCTPHPIKWMRDDGSEITIPASGVLPRVSSKEVVIDDMFVKTVYGDIEGLPEPEEGVILIVSAMVRSASNRTDLCSPNTGASAIRDEAGRILAVRNFILNA